MTMMNQDEADEKRRALIEKRAFEIYESRGGSHGFDREDWEQAEREIDGTDGADTLPADDQDEIEENKGNVA